MTAPEKHCEFEAVQVPVASHVAAPSRLEYRCRTHGMSGFRPDSTVTEFGAYTLCPVGKIEYATQLALEKIAAATPARLD